MKKSLFQPIINNISEEIDEYPELNIYEKIMILIDNYIRNQSNV